MLTRAQKSEEVDELRDKLGRAASIFVADYRGIDVQQANRLRSKLRSDGAGDFEYRVAKNTLLRRATSESDLEVLQVHFEGPTAIALSFGDPVQLAKVLVEYAKENEVFEIKGGYLEGKAIDRQEIATLATLPSLDELRGRLVGLLQAPATKVVRLLCEPGAQLARLAQARSQSLEGGD